MDGYNVIHSNRELAIVAADSLDMARRKLCDALCEFKALTRYRIIVVFDAHFVSGGEGSVEGYGNIKVVFTKEAESADDYIEHATYKLVAKKDKITVATSDVLEQLITLGQGATRISAEDLWIEIENAREEMRTRYNKQKPIKKNPLASLIDPESLKKLEEMRMGNMPETPKPSKKKNK